MELIPIPEAAAKYDVCVKRLRGAVYMDNQNLCPSRVERLPIGDLAQDVVQDDEFLARWVRSHKSEGAQ